MPASGRTWVREKKGEKERPTWGGVGLAQSVRAYFQLSVRVNLQLSVKAYLKLSVRPYLKLEFKRIRILFFLEKIELTASSPKKKDMTKEIMKDGYLRTVGHFLESWGTVVKAEMQTLFLLFQRPFFASWVILRGERENYSRESKSGEQNIKK